MLERLTSIAALLMLSACVWQESQPTDIITTLSTPVYGNHNGVEGLHYPEINHSAALRAFKRDIADGQPVDTTDAHGLPAVAHAAAVGDVAFLAELIARGAELNYPAALNRPEPGNSCLFSGDELSATGLAARYGQTAALQLLLQHGARPYGTEMAIIHNHLDCLQLLHAAGADLHEGEYTTDGVFYPATCNARSEEVLRFLIDHGVSPAIPFDNNINHRCSDVPSAERYLNMYRNTGVWTPQQIEEFRRTSPLYRTVAPSPAPQ